ncbi:MAG: cupin [Betaproteobacteria bacterium]|nr:MAG: cupin [Betaproteobacteria bacterium]
MNSAGFDPRYRKGDELPWVPFAPYNDKVGIKLLQVDPIRGEMVLLMRVPAGVFLGAHNHRGRVVLYTIRGGWRYLEHDWVARTGDFVYETAGSRHSFQGEPDSDTEMFVIVDGSLEFLDAEGNIYAIEDWRSMLKRLEAHCHIKGIPVPDLVQFPRA